MATKVEQIDEQNFRVTETQETTTDYNVSNIENQILEENRDWAEQESAHNTRIAQLTAILQKAADANVPKALEAIASIQDRIDVATSPDAVDG